MFSLSELSGVPLIQLDEIPSAPGPPGMTTKLSTRLQAKVPSKPR